MLYFTLGDFNCANNPPSPPPNPKLIKNPCIVWNAIKYVLKVTQAWFNKNKHFLKIILLLNFLNLIRQFIVYMSNMRLNCILKHNTDLRNKIWLLSLYYDYCIILYLFVSSLLFCFFHHISKSMSIFYLSFSNTSFLCFLFSVIKIHKKRPRTGILIIFLCDMKSIFTLIGKLLFSFHMEVFREEDKFSNPFTTKQGQFWRHKLSYLCTS